MWTFEHSVDCRVSRDFAWRFWTDVSNWAVVDSSVEAPALDGPFQSGTKGSSKPRGREPIHWHLEDVQDGRNAVVMIHVPGASLRSVWTFEDSGVRRTRITQQATIVGDRAVGYIPTVAAELERGIPQGMQKLAEAIEHLALGSALGRWLCLF